MKKSSAKREKKTVEIMIRLFCSRHHDSYYLCSECNDLNQYARERIEKCHFGSQKPVCSECPVHCYKQDYREKIRIVMRYSGPRIIITHPILTIIHMINKWEGVI